MQYGRNLDVTGIGNGNTEYFAIPVEEDAESVLVEIESITASGLGAGSIDFSFHTWDDKGDLREVADSDVSSGTQRGSTVNHASTSATDFGVLMPSGANGFFILEVTNNADSGTLDLTGDMVTDATYNAGQDDDSQRTPLEHATEDNLSYEVFTEGTPQ